MDAVLSVLDAVAISVGGVTVPRWIIEQYGAVVVGTLIGATAHFGRMISSDAPIRFRAVVGYVLQLGLIALISAAVAQTLGIHSDLMRSLTASVLTVAANEVVDWFRGRARNVMQAVDALSGKGPV